MPAPIVMWRKGDNSAQVSSWPIGTVDAGTVSSDFSVLIWNNYAGASDVSDMQDVTITTKDQSGGNSGELVTNKWIEARVDGTDTVFTPIGGAATKTIKAPGSTTNGDGTLTPGQAPHNSSTGSVDILGVKNDGGKTTAQGNFVPVTLHANVPADAGAGTTNFVVRVSYKYV